MTKKGHAKSDSRFAFINWSVLVLFGVLGSSCQIPFFSEIPAYSLNIGIMNRSKVKGQGQMYAV